MPVSGGSTVYEKHRCLATQIALPAKRHTHSIPEFSSFTRDDMALVTLSAANSKSSLRFLPAERSPKACLISPSTPLSGGGLEFTEGSTFGGGTGDLLNMSLDGESSILSVLGLRGVRGEPACKANRNNDVKNGLRTRNGQKCSACAVFVKKVTGKENSRSNADLRPRSEVRW